MWRRPDNGRDSELLTQQKYGTAEHSVSPNRNPVCYW